MMCDFEYCTKLGPTPKMGGKGRAAVNLQVKQLRKMQYDQQKTNAHMANKARQAPVATPHAGLVEKIAGCPDLILTIYT